MFVERLVGGGAELGVSTDPNFCLLDTMLQRQLERRRAAGLATAPTGIASVSLGTMFLPGEMLSVGHSALDQLDRYIGSYSEPPRSQVAWTTIEDFVAATCAHQDMQDRINYLAPNITICAFLACDEAYSADATGRAIKGGHSDHGSATLLLRQHAAAGIVCAAFLADVALAGGSNNVQVRNCIITNYHPHALSRATTEARSVLASHAARRRSLEGENTVSVTALSTIVGIPGRRDLENGVSSSRRGSQTDGITFAEASRQVANGWLFSEQEAPHAEVSLRTIELTMLSGNRVINPKHEAARYQSHTLFVVFTTAHARRLVNRSASKSLVSKLFSADKPRPAVSGPRDNNQSPKTTTTAGRDQKKKKRS